MTQKSKCPKCPGILFHSQTKKGAAYSGCPLCKGMWISLIDLPKIFDNPQVAELFKGQGLAKPVQTTFRCPNCSDYLQSGTVGSSDLRLDECTKCQSYFFDDREIKKLYELMQEPELPQAQTLKVDMDNLIELKNSCPLCKDQKLWGLKDNANGFCYCPKCEGIGTNVPTLQKLAKRSLFQPSMFIFRKGQGEVAVCRHCQEPQEARNASCRKCGRELMRANCHSCKARMSEYSLQDIIIERCQICSSIWLDAGEFEKVLLAMPDVKRMYEEGFRQSELLSTQVLAASHVYSYGIENTTRHMINRFWGIAGVLFF